MRLFPHNELRYYSCALRAGVTNLFSNGLRLGIKKTLGKITQPINAHSRFPEYYWFDAAIRDYLLAVPAGQRVKVLDVGSPKMFGLYLAQRFEIEITLTDISELNVDEYRVIWRSLEPKAKGKAVFLLQDARSLQFADAEFDIVYSMSVVEHIEGETGDSQAIRELLRVLKPGGLLVLSVPFGSRFVEQKRIGFVGAVRKTEDQSAYFFQRIYDQSAFEKRILEPARELEQVSLTTVWRKRPWMPRSFCLLGENVRGALGFVNPLLSAAVNRSKKGIDPAFAVDYGDVHTARDVYSDLIMSGRKR
jgi:SAM-dependent methyltransferase